MNVVLPGPVCKPASETVALNSGALARMKLAAVSEELMNREVPGAFPPGATADDGATIEPQAGNGNEPAQP